MQRKAYLLIISFHPHNNFMKDGGTAIIVPTMGFMEAKKLAPRAHLQQGSNRTKTLTLHIPPWGLHLNSCLERRRWPKFLRKHISTH